MPSRRILIVYINVMKRYKKCIPKANLEKTSVFGPVGLRY